LPAGFAGAVEVFDGDGLAEFGEEGAAEGELAV
jgi:hypothetical protein